MIPITGKGFINQGSTLEWFDSRERGAPGCSHIGKMAT